MTGIKKITLSQRKQEAGGFAQASEAPAGGAEFKRGQSKASLEQADQGHPGASRGSSLTLFAAPQTLAPMEPSPQGASVKWDNSDCNRFFSQHMQSTQSSTRSILSQCSSKLGLSFYICEMGIETWVLSGLCQDYIRKVILLLPSHPPTPFLPSPQVPAG